MRTSVISTAIGILLMPMMAGPARAADRFWDGDDMSGDADGGSGVWDNLNNNWDTVDIGGDPAVWNNTTPDNAAFGIWTTGTVTLGSDIIADAVNFGVQGFVLNSNGHNATFIGEVSGFAFTKSGAGTLTLSGSATCSGQTLVNSGVLALNCLLTASVGVDANATLTGTGGSAGAVLVNGTLAPGSGIGAFSTGDLTLAGESVLAIQIANWTGVAGTDHDTVNATRLIISASAGTPAVLSISPLALANFSEINRDFVLVHTSGGISGFNTDHIQLNTTAMPGNGIWTLSQSATDLVLHYTAGGDLVDSNHNGILDGYEIATYGSLNVTTGLSNTDHDSLNDLLEYALGTNPLVCNPDNANLVTDIEDLNGEQYLRLTVTRNPAASNLTYSVQTGGEPMDWNTSNTFIEVDTSTTLVVRDTFPMSLHPKRFIRLKVEAE